MGKELKMLFDFQKLQGNKKLRELIDEIEIPEEKTSAERINQVNESGTHRTNHSENESKIIEGDFELTPDELEKIAGGIDIRISLPPNITLPPK